MNVHHNKLVDWKNVEVIEQVSSNLQALLELTSKTINAVATLSDLTMELTTAYVEGAAKVIDEEKLSAIANLFAIKDNDLLSKKFPTESERTVFWEDHLTATGLMKPSDAKRESTLVEDGDVTLEEVAAIEPESEERQEVHTAETSDDENEKNDSALHLHEPVWADSIVSLGEVSFDITSKEVRRNIVLHVRAAKGEKSFKDILEGERLSSRSTGWFSGLEKGIARITQSEVEALAEGCGVSVGILLTGFGLDKTKMLGNTRGKKNQSNLSLPSFSDDELQVFFKTRVLNANVQPAEGVAVGQLMELAINQDQVDWIDAFLTLTERGSKIQKNIENEIERLGKVADQIKVVMLIRIVSGLWPDTKE